MSMKGVVEAKTKDGFGMLIDGEWYSNKFLPAMKHVQKGDTVSFEYKLDKTGRYKNVTAVTVEGSAPSAAPSAAPKRSYGDNQVGVEVGHAMNCALQVCLHSGIDPSTPEFYKALVEHTEKMYVLARKIRAMKSADPEASLMKESAPAVVSPEEEPLLDVGESLF